MPFTLHARHGPFMHWLYEKWMYKLRASPENLHARLCVGVVCRLEADLSHPQPPEEGI